MPQDLPNFCERSARTQHLSGRRVPETVGTSQTGSLQQSLLPTLASSARAAPYDAIDTFLQQQLDRLHVPGAAVAIVKGDQIVHARGFGRARPDRAPPSPQTPFFIGSLTKSFTALAVMQLVESGKVELDAPVLRYLPWFRVADHRVSAQMTVRQLLNQTSGLPTTPGWAAMADFDQRPGPSERHARALAGLERIGPVGSTFEYTNTNFDLLGLVVEAVSGERYATYVEDHIFRPLQMGHSYTRRTEAQQNGLAMGYRYWFAHPVAAPGLPESRGCLASGELISSAEDIAHYLIAQLNGGRYGDTRVLSATGIAEMHRPAVDVNQGILHGKYGMGWFIEDRGPTTFVWHDGVVPDFFAYMTIVPAQKTGFILLLNADNFLMLAALSEVGHGVRALLAGDKPTSRQFDLIPWVARGLLLVPLLQIVGVLATLRRLRGWQGYPHRLPSRRRMWMLHVLLPLIPNLLLSAASMALITHPLRGFMFLFGPDISWTALICGSFAAIWSFVRTGLTLRTFWTKPPGGRPSGMTRKCFCDEYSAHREPVGAAQRRDDSEGRHQQRHRKSGH